MKAKTIACLPIFLLIAMTGDAQFTENFSDGDFSANPAWTGSPASWIVNNTLQLQSNNTVANSNFYLSTASALATSAEWDFYVNLKFATSGTNYVDVYLTSASVDLTSIANTGYFVRIGNTADEISLCRKDAGVAAGLKIIDGADGAVSSATNNQVKIKVLRNAANQWTLFRDITVIGNSYFSEGNVTDATYITSSFFGILVKQSTVAGFSQKHFFDDILVKPYAPDITPPVVLNTTVLSANNLDVLFNEPLSVATSQLGVNYVLNSSLGNPVSAVLDTINPALVHLTFVVGFTSGTNYQLTVNGVTDLAGNGMINSKSSFIYFAPYLPRQYDIVIDEIMADPTPQVGLPNNEWIELKNMAANAINLQGWKIGDATGESGPMPVFVLLPDSFVIVCAGNSVAAMSAFGNTIGVSAFPSLDNTSDLLFLKSPQNNIIHAVGYKDSWYQNELKKAGGWTLEMIDTKNPCSGFNNWKVSSDIRGGSPGHKNSVNAVNADKSAPRLLRAYTTDSIHITLVFDEPLDSLKAVKATNFIVSDGIGTPVAAFAVAPLFDRINLKFNTPLLRSKIYKVTVAAVTDCMGNIVSDKTVASLGLPEVAAPTDIVINEILFNPPPAGNDYVEIYNRSNKVIDLKQTYIANRNSSGIISSIAQLSSESYLFFPGEFMVVTESAAQVKMAYITQKPDAFIEIAAMPSFNDDKGNVLLLNMQGEITDELNYSEKWHFKLVDNPEGVALERIDYNAPTQSADNWHSAATSSGYGTPGYKNSQYRMNDGVQGELKLSPEIVSPDNDGQDDFATVDYNFPGPGYVANITIFTASGRPVRYLQRNAMCGTKGNFRWDGLGEKNQQLATGVYVVFTEIFNQKGRRQQFKNAIVLTRRN